MVRVVQQNVAVAQHREDTARHLTLGQARMGGRHERRVLQLWPVALVVDLPQRGQVDQAGHPQYVLAVHIEFADQQTEHVIGDRGGHLQAYRRAEAALGQFPLQGL